MMPIFANAEIFNSDVHAPRHNSKFRFPTMKDENVGDFNKPSFVYGGEPADDLFYGRDR
jgi:hypothetical protein